MVTSWLITSLHLLALGLGVWGIWTRARTLALEVWPMATLIGWRIAQARGQTLNLSPAPTFALISWVQLALTLVMVWIAVAVTRGLGG